MDLGTIAGIVSAIAAVIGLPSTLIALRKKGEAKSNLTERTQSDHVLVKQGVWRVGMYDYPPLSEVPRAVGAGSFSGPLPLMADLLANRLGYRQRLFRFAYSEFYDDEIEKPDMVFGMFRTERRERYMVFSRPLYEISLQGICRQDQQGDVLDRLRDGDLRVAVYSGEAGWEFLKDEIPEAFREQRVAVLAGGEQMHTMEFLLSGSYDVVLMDHLSCFNFLRRGANNQLFKIAFPTSPKTYETGIALRRDHAALLPKINTLITELRNSTEFLRCEAEAVRGFEAVIQRRAIRKRLSDVHSSAG